MLGGVDIGGTKIGVCLGDETGRVVASSRIETDAAAPAEGQLEHALRELEGLARSAGLTSPDRIGVSCPGPYDRRSRTLLTPPNLPSWHGFRIGAFFDRAAPCATRIMNAANATALAEWLWGGHGADVSTLAYLTMSTGFGAGVVVDGEVLEGRRGFAGEVGRIRLAEFGPVGFGAMGTAEGFLSGPGMAQLGAAEALRRRQSGEPSALRDAPRITAEVLCELAGRGDPGARAVVGLVARKLGELIAIIANVLEPEVVVLGTIGAAHPDLFIPTATESMRAGAVPETAAGLRIVPSRLGDRGDRSALAVATLAASG